MPSQDHFREFSARFKLLVGKRPELTATTLSNIFTMRLIGNKTHGDLAEIAISEFINQYMYDYRSEHVGKALFRAKTREEDVKIISEVTSIEFPLSLKAYGEGPLQLSTDKAFTMFPRLESAQQQWGDISGRDRVSAVLRDHAFASFQAVNVLSLIYSEKRHDCNILAFDYERALAETTVIKRVDRGRGRRHPVYRFYNKSGGYICEVRYGDATANALQRGLWTHTKHGYPYFDSITDGWIAYAENEMLVQLLSNSLVSSGQGHRAALAEVLADIERLKSLPEVG